MFLAHAPASVDKARLLTRQQPVGQQIDAGQVDSAICAVPIAANRRTANQGRSFTAERSADKARAHL